MADYRGQISLLDNKIQDTQNKHEKLMFLDEAIELNKNYARALKRPVVGKFIFGTIILPLGLIALFPQAIVRLVKASNVYKRIDRYEQMRNDLRNKLNG